MVSLALIAVLLHTAPAGAPPVPSDCEIEQTQDLSAKLHFGLSFVDARCAGESVAYLCTDTKCLKDPCGGMEGQAPRLLMVAKAPRARGKRGAKKSRSHSKKGAPKAGAPGQPAAEGTAPE